MCKKCLTRVQLDAKREKLMHGDMLGEDSSRLNRYDQALESTDIATESDASFDSELLQL